MARKMIPEVYCLGCQRVHPISEFYKSNSPFHPNGYLPYCKEEIKNILDHYLSKTKNLESAVWLTCSVLNLPFIKRAYDLMVQDYKSKDIKSYNYMGMYLSKLQAIDLKTGERKYKDFSDSDMDFNELSKIKEAESVSNDDKTQMFLDWGEQSTEDYSFLENLFYKYTGDLNLDDIQEGLYRDLCLARLRKRKLESGINDEINEQDLAKVQDQIFKIITKLKIDDFESQQKSPVEQLIFERIKMVEETMPCEYEDKKKYRDIDGIGKYLKDLIFRPMLNTLTGTRDFNVKDVHDYELNHME